MNEHDLTTEAVPDPPRFGRRQKSNGDNKALAFVFALTLIGIAATVAFFMFRAPNENAITSLAPDQRLTLTGDVGGVAVTPDGATVAYLSDGATAIQVRAIDGGSPLEVFRHPASQPLDQRALFWNSTGDMVHFVTVLEGRSGLFAISSDGGDPSLILDFEPFLGQVLSVHGMTGVGAYVVSVNGEVYIGPDIDGLSFDGMSLVASGGSVVDTEQAIVLSASVSPSGNWLAYGALGEGISDVATGVVRVDGTMNRILSTDNRELGVEWNRWKPSGASVYFLRRTHGGKGDIVSIDIDPRSGEPEGPPFLVYPQLTLRGLPDISADGLTLVYAGGTPSTNFRLIEVDGGEQFLLFASGTSQNHTPAFSSDGSALVFVRSAAAGLGYRVIQRDVESGEERIVTERQASGVACGGRISPDGNTFALVDVGYAGRSSLVLIDLMSGDVRELTLPRGGCTPDFAPDGSRVAILPYIGSEEVVTIVDTRTGESEDLRLQCDTGCGFAGEQIAISSAWPLAAATSDDDLWVADLTNGSLIPLAHGIHHVFLWAADGYIYFTREPSDRSDSDAYGLFRITAGGGEAEFLFDLPEDCSPFTLVLSRDASKMVCAVEEPRPDVHLIRGFDPSVVE